MKIWIAAVAIVGMLAGCIAKAPSVIKVAENDKSIKEACINKKEGCKERPADTPYTLFYALPRTDLTVTLPLVQRTLKKPVIVPVETKCVGKTCSTTVLGDVDYCAVDHFGKLQLDPNDSVPIKVRLDPESACYWRFKKAELPNGAALLCDKENPRGLYRSESPITATTSNTPDPGEIYAVSLKPEFFSKLKASLEFSPNGALTQFAATATSAGKEGVVLFTKVALAATTGVASPITLLNKRNDEFPKRTVKGMPEYTLGKEFEEVLGKLAELEDSRLKLIMSGKATAEALAAISAQQTVLRRLIEGSVQEGPLVLTIPFNLGKSMTRSVSFPIREGAVCQESPVSATIDFDPVPGNSTFVDVQEPTSTKDQDGFRYRVPRLFQAKMRLATNDSAPPSSPPSTGAAKAVEPTCFDDPPKKPGPELKTQVVIPSCLDVQGSLSIAQWGVVRQLPRRIGYGSGSLSASLDPVSGGLKSVSNESEGAGQQILLTTLEEVQKDHGLEAMKDEATKLELKLKLCKLRADMGLPPAEGCPAPVPST